MRQTLGVVEDCRKIAVLRANAVGDFLFALPALEALRATYWAAEIVLIGREWHARFLQDRPGPVDRIVAIPGVVYGEDPLHTDDIAALSGVVARLEEERFDVALQLHGGGRYSNPFVRRLGARVTAGSRTPDAAPLDRWVPYYRLQNEVLRYLEIVSLVGARPVELAPRLVVTERDLEEAARIVPEDATPTVVLHPGARDPRRRWPAAHFAALGDALAQRRLRVVVNGDRSERQLVAEVLSRMRSPAIDVGSDLSLRGLAGLLSRAALVVSNDSGPLHLGMAVGAPAVGIYWYGNLITGCPSTSRRHAWHVSWRACCPVCGISCHASRCAHDASFVADVPVEAVLASAQALLADGDYPAPVA